MAAVLGPPVVAYWFVPREALAAWPVMALTFLPALLVIVATLVFRGYRPLIEAPLRDSAGTWLGRTLKQRGLGVGVAALPRGQNTSGSFFHPSGMIVLGEDVHGEHTARAYATAAHELGHAIFHMRGRWVGRAMFAARQYARGFFNVGIGLLLGCTLVGGAGMRMVAFAVLALAVVLQALVVVDEAIANATARRVLRDELGDGEQVTIARGHMRRAFATYAALLVGYLFTLAVAPSLLATIGDGVLVPGAPLAGTSRTIATVISVASVLGAVIVLRNIIVPTKGAAILVSAIALLWTPLLTVLVWDQSTVPAWTIVMATAPTWAVLSTPVAQIVNRMASFLCRDLDVEPVSFRAAGALDIRRISLDDLSKHETDDTDGLLARFVSHSSMLWAVPLALAWLLSLLGAA